MVEGGSTPLVPAAELREFAVVLFANIALQAAVKGMQTVLAEVRRTGSVAGIGDRIAPWTERQRLVRKPTFDGLEDKYRTPATAEVASCDTLCQPRAQAACPRARLRLATCTVSS
jgi:hypothetical protein